MEPRRQDEAEIRLKRLLFAEEIEVLDRLEAGHARLAARVGDDAAFARSVGRALADMLAEADPDERARLAYLLKPVLAEALAEEPATREGLRRTFGAHGDKLVGAGHAGGFRRALGRLDRALVWLCSPMRWRARLEALVTRQSTADVLARRHPAFRVRRFLLIDRHRTRTLILSEDASGDAGDDIAAGIEGVVTTFGRDLVAGSDAADVMVRTVSFRDGMLTIASSPALALAVFWAGPQPSVLEARVEDLFRDLTERLDLPAAADHRPRLDVARGHLDARFGVLEAAAAPVVSGTPVRAITALVVVAAVGLGVAGREVWHWREARELEQAARAAVFEDARLRGFALDVSASPDADRVTVAGLVPDAAAADDLRQRLGERLGDTELVLDLDALTPSLARLPEAEVERVASLLEARLAGSLAPRDDVLAGIALDVQDLGLAVERLDDDVASVAARAAAGEEALAGDLDTLAGAVAADVARLDGDLQALAALDDRLGALGERIDDVERRFARGLATLDATVGELPATSPVAEGEPVAAYVDARVEELAARIATLAEATEDMAEAGVVADLSSDLEAARGMLAALDARVAEGDGRLGGLEAITAEQASALAMLDARTDENAAAVERIEADFGERMDAAEAGVVANRDRLEAAGGQTETVAARVSELEASTDERLDALAGTLDGQASALADARAVVADTTSRLDEAETEIAAFAPLAARVEDQATHIAAMEHEAAETSDRVNALEGAAGDLDSAVAGLRRDMVMADGRAVAARSRLEARVDAMASRVDDATAATARTARDQAAMAERLALVETAAAERAAGLEAARADLQELRDRLGQAENVGAGEAERVAALGEALVAIEADLTESRETIGSLQAEARAERARLGERIEAAAAAIAPLDAGLGELADDVAALSASIATLRTDVSGGSPLLATRTAVDDVAARVEALETDLANRMGRLEAEVSDGLVVPTIPAAETGPEAVGAVASLDARMAAFEQAAMVAFATMDERMERLSREAEQVGGEIAGLGGELDGMRTAIEARLAAMESESAGSIAELDASLSRFSIPFLEGETLTDATAAEATLREVATLILRADPSVKLRVVGYADPDRGNIETNRLASEHRAEVIVEMLTRMAVPEDRMLAIGRGTDRLVSPEFGRGSPNRRVEFEAFRDPDAAD